jgi:2-(1,2-epoxy-1,2-dihydrophenyl)acetyl-CoA isomerase
MSDEVILTSVHERVATLTLNRPDRLNALSPDLITKSIETLTRWSEDPGVAVIVVTGAGRAFCAGGDVGAMSRENDAPRSLEQRIDSLRRAQQLSALLYEMPKVTIACVNGYAMGAGLGICLSCDLRIASDQAKFGTAYSKVGFGGDFGTTWLLTRYLGAPRAKELLFTADPFDAADALRWGLVSRVTPADALASETRAFAARLADGPLVSYRYMKANVNLSATADFRTMLDREAETHLRCGETRDHREGVQAFLEKRAAKFQGA